MSFNVLSEYPSLLDSYLLDFFTENHLHKLPGSWGEQIRHIPLEEFYFLMDLIMDYPFEKRARKHLNELEFTDLKKHLFI